ncbi:DUF3592 domain-containing protein [Histidinibacterium lentulum]|uniref:DUF3592 domain-containing protein n=1 Tax=Histidinibacterium lentulum TaxID=2480588 RepID=A0A3N2R545_9RHOB|nr:DUF3592 domain-containing protein [Histidinibacterium lentulum]ROU02609.1 DUF3592 domain-containing protein [Histidinibacterium lentulum]
MAWQSKSRKRQAGPVAFIVIIAIGIGVLAINAMQKSKYEEIAARSDSVTGEIVDKSRSGNSYRLDFEFTHRDETYLLERHSVQPGFYQDHRVGDPVEVLVPRMAPRQAILAGNHYFGWIFQLAGIGIMLIGAAGVLAPMIKRRRG